MLGSLTRDRCVPCLCEPILTDGIAWTSIGTEADIVRGWHMKSPIRAVAATVMSVQGQTRNAHDEKMLSAMPPKADAIEQRRDTSGHAQWPERVKISVRRH